MITLDLAAAAKFLNVHKTTMRTMAATGKVPGGKIGREWRFTEVDLLAHLRAQYRVPVQPSCPSINALKLVTSGTSTYRIPVSLGYVGRLEQQIAQRRKKSTTS